MSTRTRTFFIPLGGGGSEPTGCKLSDVLNINFENDYDTGRYTDIQEFLNDTLPLEPILDEAGFISLKPLTVTVGDYQWSEPDEFGYARAAAGVTITYPDGSTVTQTLNFYRLAEGKLPVKLSNVSSYINTGLNMDYSYQFEGECYVSPNTQGVLIDSFVETGARTSLRMLGSSRKFQHMWPSNKEFTNTGIDFNKPFNFIVNAENLEIRQGNVVFTTTITGSRTSGTVMNPVILMNSAVDYTFGNTILLNAKIKDSNGNVLRNFVAEYVNNELVLVDKANNDTIYRPVNGTLVDMSQTLANIIG